MTTVARISAALSTMSRRCRDDNLGCITVFLCICEHNGICIKDVVHLCGLSEAKVSRSVEALRLLDGGGLVDVHRHPTDGRKRLVFLTDNGEALRKEMEHIFKEAVLA
jgi:DNA-binding MarR family transcriptional regulator